MSRSLKRLLLAAIVWGFVFAANACSYESQRWCIGQWPNRIGIVGINDETTKICLGNESYGGWGPFYLNIHPYWLLGLVTIPLLVWVAFISFRRLLHQVNGGSEE